MGNVYTQGNRERRRQATAAGRRSGLPTTTEMIAYLNRFVQVQTRDLVEFGMIPELVGRFATIAAVHELSVRDLRNIVNGQIEDSPLAQQRLLARLHGIELELTEEALDAIAEQAAALGTGARGLHRLIGRAMDAVDYRWSELADQGIGKVTVTRECVERGAPPELVAGPPVATRIDRALRRESLAGLDAS